MVTPQKPKRSGYININNNNNNNNSRSSNNRTDDQFRVDARGDGTSGRVVGSTEATVMACAEVAQALLSSCVRDPTSHVYDGSRYELLATLARTMARAILPLHASGALHWRNSRCVTTLSNPSTLLHSTPPQLNP